VSVTRYDAAKLGKVSRTPQGFLRAPARLTRTGVLTYRRSDGTVVRELRRPEQVFRAESLASLADAPLTDLHPAVMVSPSNARDLSVGHVSGASARPDGRFVEAEVVVTDAAMIDAIEQGTRREISCGYKCKLKPGGGTYNGEHYDAEQIDIEYNHAGLLPPNAGRAGSEVALRLDGKRAEFELGADDACVLDAADEPPEAPPKGPTMDMQTIRIDGIDVSVPQQSAQLLTRTIEQHAKTVSEHAAKTADLQKRIDSLQGELDSTKAKLTEASDPKRFDAALAERMSLLERVRPVLGAEVKLDGLSVRELKEKTLKALVKDIDLAGKSDAYVDARFDGALEQLPSGGGTRRTNSSLEDARRQSTLRSDAKDQNGPVYKAPAWRSPLRTSSRQSTT